MVFCTLRAVSYAGIYGIYVFIALSSKALPLVMTNCSINTSENQGSIIFLGVVKHFKNAVKSEYLPYDL